MPERQGASAWPREGPSRTVLCDPLEMPLSDAAIDLTIAVHALEHVADAEELMRELWRITAPNGHLVMVVARQDATEDMVISASAAGHKTKRIDA